MAARLGLTVLFAAAEALLVVAVGLAIPLALMTVLWGAQFGFGPEWALFGRAAVDVWLLGHGVDISFTLDPLLATSLGLPGAEAPIRITMALLGFALLTVLLAVRAARRIAESSHPVIGLAVAVAMFAAVSTVLAVVVWHPAAMPSRWQAAILPALIFAIGMLLGTPRDVAAPLGGLARRIPDTIRGALAALARTGFATVAALVLIAALVTAGAIGVKYAPIISLYESLQTQTLGGVAVTLGELAILPNLVIWTASWLVGPGFAIGAGSSVSPLGTNLGPVPAIPVLGALPNGDPAIGLAGVAVPVGVAFVAAAILAPAMRRAGLREGWLVLVGVGAGILGGVVMGVLAWFSGGMAGPGRLAVVGPDPAAVGVIAALEFAVGAGLGLAAASWRARR